MSIKSIRTGWTGISALAGNPVIGDFESIQTVTVGSGGQANVEFTNIPSSYQHLQIRYMVRGTRAAADSQFALRYNGFTSNYTRHRIVGDGSTASANGTTAQAYFDLYDIPGSTATGSTFGVGVIDILDYTNTNKLKTFRALRGDDRNGSGSVGLHSTIYTSTNSTNAITSFELYCADGNIAQHSHFALYGIR